MPVRRPAIVLALAALFAAAAAPAEARRSVPQGFHAAFWDSLGPQASAAAQERQWALMARSGVESVRTVFSWSTAQPDPAVAPSFHETDRLVELATRRRIRLLPVVIYAPEWARRDPAQGNSPPDVAAYAVFLRELVHRYGPAGSFWAARPDLPRRPLREWQLWNEPQLQYQWNTCELPEADNGCPGWPREYGELLRAGRAALRAEDPGAKAVLAGVTNRSWDALERLYREGGIRGHVDVVTMHPYTGSPENVVKTARRIRAVMRRHGGRRLPLWVTELAWPASRGRARPPRGLEPLATNDRGMAARLERAYDLLARTRRDARVGVSRVYWYQWSSSYRGDVIFDYTGLLSRRGSVFRARPALRTYTRSARRLQGCTKSSAGVCRRR